MSYTPHHELKNNGIWLDGEEVISFRRTIRVPDNSTHTSSLPPDLGRIPLFKIRHYTDILPASMVAKGDLFMPMHSNEAMWIKFTGSHQYAVKIYAGGVNVISGEPKIETAASMLRRRTKLARGELLQDYVVIPQQRWIDGVAIQPGKVRQFVATTMGSGHSIEAQLTGLDDAAGIQFEIMRIAEPTISMRNHRVLEYASRREMNLAPGGRIRQNIVPTPQEVVWDPSRSITFNVQIVNATVFDRLTRREPDPSPAPARPYGPAGLLFYHYRYHEERTTISGHFSSLRSIGQLERLENREIYPWTRIEHPRRYHDVRRNSEVDCWSPMHPSRHLANALEMAEEIEKRGRPIFF